MITRERKIENLAKSMNVSVSDVNSFIDVLSYELKNGASTLEEAIEISIKKFQIMLKHAKSVSQSESMRKIVTDWFYGS